MSKNNRSQKVQNKQVTSDMNDMNNESNGYQLGTGNSNVSTQNGEAYPGSSYSGSSRANGETSGFDSGNSKMNNVQGTRVNTGTNYSSDRINADSGYRSNKTGGYNADSSKRNPGTTIHTTFEQSGNGCVKSEDENPYKGITYPMDVQDVQSKAGSSNRANAKANGYQKGSGSSKMNKTQQIN